MSCSHAHTVCTEPRPYTSAAGERRAAQGNVSWDEICSHCGASRQVDSNAGLDYGPWELVIYSVRTIADKELDRITPRSTGRRGQALLDTACALAKSRVRQGNGAVAVYRDGQRVAGPYILRHLTTVDTHGRAVECHSLPRKPRERLGTEHAPPVRPPAVRWIETACPYEPGETVDEAA